MRPDKAPSSPVWEQEVGPQTSSGPSCTPMTTQGWWQPVGSQHLKAYKAPRTEVPGTALPRGAAPSSPHPLRGLTGGTPSGWQPSGAPHRLLSASSPRAPPNFPRQPAPALPPRLFFIFGAGGKGKKSVLAPCGGAREAGSLPPSSPPSPGSPARRSLVEAPALHRRAVPGRAGPGCAVPGSGLGAAPPRPRYERR